MNYFKSLPCVFKVLLIPSIVFFLSNQVSFAANQPPASQQMSGQERARQMQEEQENLEYLIEQPKYIPKKEEKPLQEVPVSPTAQKVFVKSINVTGVTLFPNMVIRAITSQYENKELSFNEIQKIADLITDLYRKKGYVISRAYIPQQTLEGGALEIRVIESKIGDILLKGNHYYSTKLIMSYLTIKKGDFFNYNDLKKDLNNMNDHPDRTVRSVLVAGKEPGTTDIVLNETDSLPVHVQLGFNNYLSSFLGHNIYTSNFTDNNLLGQDDILTFDYERGDANAYYSYSTHYLYPVTKSLNMGVYASRSEEVLGGQFADVNSRGTSSMYGAYGSQDVCKNDYLDSHLNFGFDYIDNFNFLEGNLSSRDLLRVAKVGFDVDVSDNWGRTLVSDDYNYGIPGIMGGTNEHLSATDVPTSRAGAGGQFVKNTLNILRLQNLFYNMTLLWKNQLQFSSSKLTSSEQYQIGGPDNNRGYGVAEAVGDQGYSMSWELTQPPYFVPKYWNIPYTNYKIYDSIKFVEFYDWSNVHLNAIQPGEKKDTTLSSAGCGIRINILKNLYVQYEIGWPLAGKPSDGKGVHHWFEITLTF
jgi:hemolysin activation/secretion protein